MQRAFVEDDHVVQTLATNRPNQPFDIARCQGDRGAEKLV